MANAKWKPAFRAIPPTAIKIALPNIVQQEGYTCGPAALAAIRAYYDAGSCEEETQVVDDMGLADDAGSDPRDVIRAVRASPGLEYKSWRSMTDKELRGCMDRGHPVMVMLQAWGDPKPPDYNGWGDGHWVVAIGYDAKGVYFEDPSLYCRRGFLTWTALSERWHDIEGPDNHATHRFGLEVWKDGVQSSRFDKRAVVIE